MRLTQAQGPISRRDKRPRCALGVVPRPRSERWARSASSSSTARASASSMASKRRGLSRSSCVNYATLVPASSASSGAAGDAPVVALGWAGVPAPGLILARRETRRTSSSRTRSRSRRRPELPIRTAGRCAVIKRSSRPWPSQSRVMAPGATLHLPNDRSYYLRCLLPAGSGGRPTAPARQVWSAELASTGTKFQHVFSTEGRRRPLSTGASRTRHCQSA
jgi:hypothetical protein